MRSATSDAPPSRSERLAWLGGTLALYAVGYRAVGAVTLGASRSFDVTLPGELRIPFVAVGIVPYSFLFVTVAASYLALSVEGARTFRRAFVVIAANFLICFAVFLVFPVHARHRVDLAPEGSLLERWVAFYYWLDPPVNLFPSLHGDMAVLSALIGFRRSRAFGWTMSLMAAGIFVGAVVIKQHYIADLVVGGVLAYVTWRAAFPRA